jgi:hypothetical protein
MDLRHPDGHLLVRSSKKAAHSDVVYYAKWRDGSGGQVKRLLGPAWVERLGGECASAAGIALTADSCRTLRPRAWRS